MDQGRGRYSVTPINDLRRAAPRSAHDRRLAWVAGKSHFKDFCLDRQHKSQFHRLGANSSGVEPALRVHRGDWAMWIIWYVAMMASLRAMGLAPIAVPVQTDDERTPFSDI